MIAASRRGQGGFSLVEVLVAVGMMVPVILSATLGLFTAMASSQLTERTQLLETAIAGYGESLRNLPTYPDCGTPAQWNAAFDGWADRWVPDDSRTSVYVSGVKYWDQASATYVDTCTSDGGAQQLALTATRDGDDLVGYVVRRDPDARPGATP